MNADCSQAFVCDAEIDADNVNDGHLAECPNGIIDIDWNTPFAFGCSTEKACPGSFHFGCVGGNVPIPGTTTSTPVPTTTTTQEGGGATATLSVMLLGCVIVTTAVTTN